MIPYGRQSIDQADIDSVVAALQSSWLTTGPMVDSFEQAIANYVGASHGVAVSSGTAALHAMMFALNIGPGDEVIVPTLTFAATANCVVFQGATPIFVDVTDQQLLIDPEAVEAAITPRTRAIIAVDYAGHPCDYASLQPIADRYDIELLTDGCHALGATYRGQRVGGVTKMTAFSFHPVKPITTGEGGMVTTNSEQLAERLRLFRNHGITSDARQRAKAGTFFYEMTELGYNYRISDIQCALGLGQIKKLDAWISRRQSIAQQYDDAFRSLPGTAPLCKTEDIEHGYHLYVSRWSAHDRNAIFNQLRAAGLGVNVHYIPVHLHPYYQQNFGTQPGQCPVAEQAYQEIISLPMFPGMSDENTADVIQIVKDTGSPNVARAA